MDDPSCSERREAVSRALADLLKTTIQSRARLFDHAAFRCLDESYQHVHIFPAVRLGLHSLQRLESIELRREQELVGVVNLANSFFAETPPLQAHRVDFIV